MMIFEVLEVHHKSDVMGLYKSEISFTVDPGHIKSLYNNDLPSAHSM